MSSPPRTSSGARRALRACARHRASRRRQAGRTAHRSPHVVDRRTSPRPRSAAPRSVPLAGAERPVSRSSSTCSTVPSPPTVPGPRVPASARSADEGSQSPSEGSTTNTKWSRACPKASRVLSLGSEATGPGAAGTYRSQRWRLRSRRTSAQHGRAAREDRGRRRHRDERLRRGPAHGCSAAGGVRLMASVDDPSVERGIEPHLEHEPIGPIRRRLTRRSAAERARAPCPLARRTCAGRSRRRSRARRRGRPSPRRAPTGSWRLPRRARPSRACRRSR